MNLWVRKMSKRSKKCDIPKSVEIEVLVRDKCCIVCGSPRGIANAHYIARSHGGLGIVENIVTLCPLCHHEMDNGKNSLEVKAIVKKYLAGLYPNFADEQRKYNKWREK